MRALMVQHEGTPGAKGSANPGGAQKPVFQENQRHLRCLGLGDKARLGPRCPDQSRAALGFCGSDGGLRAVGKVRRRTGRAEQGADPFLLPALHA